MSERANLLEHDDLGFRFRTKPNGDVLISRGGKTVTTLRGNRATDILAENENSQFSDQQQAMARMTGNYKRGNERVASLHPRNKG